MHYFSDRKIVTRMAQAFPEISEETVRGRIQRVRAETPGLSAEYIADRLIRGEHTARVFEREIRRSEAP